jgi:hypothetical protein
LDGLGLYCWLGGYSLAAGVRRTITRNTNATSAKRRGEWRECERMYSSDLY